MALLDDISASGLTPAIQRNVFLQLLRALFSSASMIRDTNLDGYVWTSSASTSKILIEVSERFKLEDLGQRPAVVLKYGGSKPRAFSMRDGLVRTDLTANTETRSFWLVSQFQIFCVAGQAAEALLLASEILIRFLENVPAFKDEYGFKRIDIPQMSKAQKLSEYKDNWVVVLNMVTFAEHESVIDLDDLPSRLGDDYDIG
jgi:hypothetical protein